MNRLITIGSMLILGAATAACNTAEPPSTVQRDVARAEAARIENVAEARKEGTEAVQREQKDVAAEQRDVDAEQKDVAVEQRDVAAELRDVNDAAATKEYEIALAEAEGDYRVATQACEALAGSAQVSCKDQADATRKSDNARAELLKPRG